VAFYVERAGVFSVGLIIAIARRRQGAKGRTMGRLSMGVTRRLILVAGLAVALITTLVGQQRTREATPDKYKWNLTDLYPSDAACAPRRTR
jgi:hypothetical protein